MTLSKTQTVAAVGVAGAIIFAIAAYAYVRNEGPARSFEGWIEAYFIFVSPDETGPRGNAIRARR